MAAALEPAAEERRTNRACTACRASRLKCSMTIDDDGVASCARCSRLGLLCVVAHCKKRGASIRGALASAKSRLGVHNRALLRDGDGPSNDTSTVRCRTEEETEDCETLIEHMQEVSIDYRPLTTQRMETMLRHAISTAKEHDHCGMMGVAMLIAHQAGMSLNTFDKVASACPGSQRASALLADATVPPCIAEAMASTRDLCVMRVLNGGKIAFKPNALWSERVCGEAELNTWKIVPAAIKYVKRCDRSRFAAFVRRSLLYAPAASDAAVGHDEPTVVIHLRVRSTFAPPPIGGHSSCVYVPHRVSVVANSGGGGGCIDYDCLRFQPLVDQPLPSPTLLPDASDTGDEHSLLQADDDAPPRKRSRVLLQFPWRRRQASTVSLSPSPSPSSGAEAVAMTSATPSDSDHWDALAAVACDAVDSTDSAGSEAGLALSHISLARAAVDESLQQTANEDSVSAELVDMLDWESVEEILGGPVCSATASTSAAGGSL